MLQSISRLALAACASLAFHTGQAVEAGKPGTVTTIAGYGFVARTGVDINLTLPGLMSTDATGYTYYSDTLNNVVYGRDPWDTSDQLAGNGLPGFSGDGGPATAARLNGPTGVATTAKSYKTDKSARIFIADTGNHRIRMLRQVQQGKDTVSIITTIAGDGSAEFKGDGGQAASAGLPDPEALVLAPDGTLYVADPSAHRVRRIDPAGTITTYAGTGESGFSGDGGAARQARLSDPAGLLLDASGALYISDRLNDRVRVVTPDGRISTAIGGGTHSEDGAKPTEAAISRPFGLAMDAKGSIFFTDGLKVRAVIGGVVRTVAGSGTSGWAGDGGDPLKATFRMPAGLAIPREEALLISDPLQRRVRKVFGILDRSGFIDTSIGAELFDDTEAASARLTLPSGVSPAADGTCLIADTGNRRIRSLEAPHDPTEPRLPLFLYTAAGGGLKPPATGLPAADADIDPPAGVVGSLAAGYYFTTGPTAQVWHVDSKGLLGAVSIPGLVDPRGLALAADGRLFVADRGASRIWVVAANGAASSFAGTTAGSAGDGGPATASQLNAPEAVALAPNGAVYVADTGNHRVRRIEPDGTIHTVAGTGQPGMATGGPAVAAPLNSPRGVAVDVDGTAYISDSLNHRIARINAAGGLTVVAGGTDLGTPDRDSLTGADLSAPAAAARFWEPGQIAFDGQGNLFIADTRNHRIRALWSARTVQSGAPGRVPGDVNGDGRVNIADVILALQIAAKLVTPTPDQLQAGDVAPHAGTDGRPYGDGRLDITDAIRILQRASGLIPDGLWP